MSIPSARQPGKSEMPGTYERPKCPAPKKRAEGNIRAPKVPVSREKARWREQKSIQSARQPGKSEMAGIYERPKCPTAWKKRAEGNKGAVKVPVGSD